MSQPDHPLASSLGLVLFGVLMVLPFWAVGALWNRVQPGRCVNPWVLPSLACAVVGLCYAITYATGSFRSDYPMVIVGLVPVTLCCPLAALRWRRPDESSDLIRRA